MVKRFNLPKIEALAAGGIYGGKRLLSSDGGVLLLCAAAYLSDLNQWQGASYDLTDAEIDTIKAMVAQATEDLLAETEDGVGDYVKLVENVYTSNVVEPTLSGIEPTDYRALKILVSGLMTNWGSSWVARIKLHMNGVKLANKYFGYGTLSYAGTVFNGATLTTDTGIILPYVAAADDRTSTFYGVLELTIFNPDVGNEKHIFYNGMVANDTQDEMGHFTGQGSVKDANEVTAISFVPVDGSTFLVGGDTTQPNELRLTAYGLK